MVDFNPAREYDRLAKAAKKGSAKLITLARDTGVPKGSLKRFLAAGYVPQPKQLLFHAAARLADDITNPSEIGFGGSRGPGKTHATFAQVAIDDCQRIDGLKVLFLRKVAKAATEALEDLRIKTLRNVPHKFLSQKSTIRFPNDSRIIVGHFATEKDIDNYLGLEYDIIVVEEATQLSQEKIDKIRSCLRSSKPNFRPRMYYTTNPGGVGHTWFKKKFIEPFRKGCEKLTRFIPAFPKDNKYLNEEYITTVLEPLTGWLREAWLKGNWDIFAGQFFSTFNYDEHTVDPSYFPGDVPDTWTVWCSLDYGFTHYTVCHLFAEFDGMVFVLDEHAARKTSVKLHAASIKAMLARHGLEIHNLASFQAGTDVFAQRGAASGETIADQYLNEGIKLRPANTDRINGAAKILGMLGDKEAEIESRILISRRCAMLIEQLPALQHNPNKPEDVLKMNVDENGNGGDDAYDSARYGVMADNSLGILI